MVRSGKSARQTRVLGRGIVARQSDGDLCADASAQRGAFAYCGARSLFSL